MSVPVVLSVLLDLQAALQAITVGGGFHYTVKSTSVVLDPEPLEKVAATETPYFIVGDVTPGERDFGRSRPFQIKDTFTVSLAFRLDVDGGNDRARKETAAWNLVADVETKLAQDAQRGGRALYTYVEQPTIYAGVPGVNQVYGEIPVKIMLVRAYGTP